MIALLVLFIAPVFGSSPPQFDHGLDLSSTRPLNIAHRGHTGVYPENTLRAFEYAIETGSNALEVDICITKDLQLIAIHESWLSDLTDVASIFPEDRKNTYFHHEQGRFITDYWTVDFTMEELRQLGVRQRDSRRDPSYDYQFGIPTLAEYLELIQISGKEVIAYIEIKDPRFINSLDIIQESGTTYEDLVLEELAAFNYTQSTDLCLVQSFNEDSIRYLAAKSDLPMNVLLRSPVSDEVLEDYATFAYGISVFRRMVVLANINNQRTGSTDLVERAHGFGLKVHVWTLRNENSELLWDYEQDPYLEFQDYLDLEVDGVITDFPGSYTRFLDAVYP